MSSSATRSTSPILLSRDGRYWVASFEFPPVKYTKYADSLQEATESAEAFLAKLQADGEVA